jgi:hypothetical protein
MVFDSQENIGQEEMARIMGNLGKVGWMCFLPEERKIDALDVVSLPEIKLEKDEKSPSQRLRAVLFVYWQQKKPTEDFEQFYFSQMNKFIEHIKEKLT